jgi:2-iminobutanoate/2-iminopropanoate deaminase
MKKVIHTADAPAAIGTYNQAVEINGFIYTSGQIGIKPGTGTLVDGGMKEQRMRVLNNINAILTAAGLDNTSIIKLTVFLTNLEGFGDVNDAFQIYFGEVDFPARSTVEVSGLPLGSLIRSFCESCP